MVGSSLNSTIFCSLIKKFTSLTMDNSMDNFVEVFNYVFVIKFEMHVHLLLEEQEFFDNNGILINYVFQQLVHLGFF
jgi:hypothetical protein